MQPYLRLLGRPELEWEGRSYPLPFERRNQLVAYLAMRRAWVGRAELAELLWPEQPAKLSQANLRKTLFRLQSLPWGGLLEAQGNALRFIARTDTESPPESGEPAGLQDLLAGYEEGGEAWTQWLAFERERLRAAWRSALLARIDAGAPAEQAIVLSGHLLAADPADEPALLAHLAALMRAGQPVKAREAYSAYESRLAVEFGLQPGAAVKAALAAMDGAAPAPSAAWSRQPGAGFIGRTVELRQLVQWLSSDSTRAVCILGQGGAGKTRLARRALEELATHFNDGTFFVPLDDIEAGGDALARLARSLNLNLTGSAPALDQIVQHLRSLRVLLVIDNIEHLPEVAASLERLLAECPGVSAILTSRVRPLLPGLQLLQLDGLPCPDPEDEESLEAFDAVRVFIAAARRVDPAFSPGPSARSVIDICRQVEGLPLALEIAAGWTRVLSCAAIAGELRHSAELLQAVDASRPARHASMEAVFGQSWALLSNAEREAFARLSVFRGGFTLASARAVTGAALPVIGALADKSLLRKEGERIQSHPLLQQLAAARLAGSSDLDATHEAHAFHFHRLLAQSQRASALGDKDVLAEIEAELENCRRAWAWAVAHGRCDLLARSSGTLRNFFDLRGRAQEGVALMQEALDDDALALAPVRPLLMSVSAHLLYRMDRYADAIATATRAQQVAGGDHDHETLLQCFKTLAVCSLRLAQYADARRYFQEALRLAPESADPRNAAAMLDNLSLVEKSEGRLDGALAMSMAALGRFRDIRDVAGEALCLNNIGTLQGDMGHTRAAIGHLQEALALCDAHALASTRTYVLANLAEQSVVSGDTGAARDYAQRAVAACQATGNRMVEAWARLHLVQVELREGRPEQARATLRLALQAGVSLKGPYLLHACVAHFADVLQAAGSADAATAFRQWVLAQPGLASTIRRQLEPTLGPVPAPPPDPLRALSPIDLATRILLQPDSAWPTLPTS